MLIDKNCTMLVCTSLADEPGPDGLYMVVFIPIQSVLDLQYVDRWLIGHYWIDIDDKDIILQYLDGRQTKRIKKILDRGKCVAIGTRPQRQRRQRAIRLDEKGEPLVRYTYSWRNLARYLDEIQLHWLQQSIEIVSEFAEQSFAVVAISEFVQALNRRQRTAKKVKPKSKERRRIKAKERRRRDRSASGVIETDRRI